MSADANVFQPSRSASLSPALIIFAFGALGLSANLALYSSWSVGHTIYASGIGAFCLIFAGTTWALSKIRAVNFGPFAALSRAPAMPRRVEMLYWIVALVGLILSLHYMITTGLLGPGRFFYNLRYAHTQGGTSPEYLGHLALFPLALALYYAYTKQPMKALAALAISIVGTLIFAERTGILFKMSSVLFVMAWVGTLKVRHALLAALAFLAMVFAIALSTGKMGSSGNQYFLLKYIGYPLTAFEQWILPAERVQCLTLVFGNVIGAVLDRVSGGDCTAVPAAPPGQFNVYTYISAPFVTFGAAGVLVAMAVLGAAYAGLFWMARRFQGYFVMMLGVLVYPLTMVFYAWQFQLSTFPYMAILLLPLVWRRPETSAGQRL